MAKRFSKKILPCFFNAVISGKKTFEYRKDEDHAEQGDTMILAEWNGKEYTHRRAVCTVTYVLRDYDEYGLPDDYCVIGFKLDEVIDATPDTPDVKSENYPCKVFISGRITGNANYINEFNEAEMFYRNKGCVVLNPARLPVGMADADYMRICMAMLDSADTAVFLPGWDMSPGSRIERQYCKYVSMPMRNFEEDKQKPDGELVIYANGAPVIIY